MEIAAPRALVDRADPPPDATAPPGGASFPQVYAELWPWAVRVAALITQDADAGQEIAQDSLLALYLDDGVVPKVPFTVQFRNRS